MEPYRPISCDLHDHLEIACLRRLRLQVELTDGTLVEGRALTTMSTSAKEEFLRLESA
ncbi:Rho-binding antiterminator, partial [Stenotrophomonas indicatrix]|uniref:Rho-binding antiterminator n=1 Tax=Stenotrophomonas indicatrix TaxID=2045451 RepID=UPI003CD036A1